MESSSEDVFGELRSLAHGAPSVAAWRRICGLIDEVDAARLEQEVLPYLGQLLDRWPAELRVMPPRWLRGPNPRARIAQRAVLRGPDEVWRPDERDPWAHEGRVVVLPRCEHVALTTDLACMVLCGSGDTEVNGGVTLFDTQARASLAVLEREMFRGRRCGAARFAPAGDRLALAMTDPYEEAMLELHEVPSGQARWSTSLEPVDAQGGEPIEEAIALAVSPSGEWVATASKKYGELLVWQLDHGSLWRSLVGKDDAPLPLDYAWDGSHVTTSHADAGPTALAFSHDGEVLAVGYRTGLVRVWDLEGAEVAAEAHTRGGELGQLCFSPDDDLLVGASLALHQWEWDGLELSWLSEQPLRRSLRDPVAMAPLAPHGVRCVVPEGADLLVWDLPDPEPRRIAREGYAPEAIGLTADATWVVGATTTHAWLCRVGST